MVTMEGETPVSSSWSRGGHVQRLENINVAAEKVHFYRQLLLHVDEQLNRARLALGAYRRGEVGPAARNDCRQQRSSSCSNVCRSTNVASVDGNLKTKEKETLKEADEKKKKEEKAELLQFCGVDNGKETAYSEEYYLLGTTFLRADSAVICNFLVNRIRQLEARRDTYRRQRKAAVAALLELSPSITDLAEAEWRLLLAEPEVQRWKEQADAQEEARQQLLSSLQGGYV